ncbi:sialate O-acetylesterase [Microbulbifer agarilyticus]|uniref:sialate O-acetylesterase n=1 Tax=Microbulbifer agarilyticus TaxID=260552 RepID=UPI001CD74223|nr:sialate O-acetylesterase [Microbulbifer agarilyticus]MCA0892160.1 hypothetical protein [Microbulbifer agarilyticus]
MAKVFSDSMVIQRGQPFNLWGTAGAGEDIKVVFNGRSYSAQANGQGRWLVTLPEQSVSTGQTIEIHASNSLALSDVAFGDVFLAGGQSNMEYKLDQVISRFPEEKTLDHYPDVRHLDVGRHYDFSGPQSDINGGQWAKAGKDTIGRFSAVGWFFAKDLSERVGVPIGVISSNVGATPIESWMSLEALQAFPEAQALAYKLSNETSRMALRAEYAQQRKSWLRKNPNQKLPWAIKHSTSLDFKPTGFFNAMIAPLQPMKFAGVIWYQGEGNTEDPKGYSDKFRGLIGLWREYFAQPKLPFMFVQLANFQKPDMQPAESRWAELRAQQAEVFSTVDYTSMALAIDVGERHDIHPKDKKTVGERLALGARHWVYGEPGVDYVSPMVSDARASGARVIINFDYIGEGLTVRGDRLSGFAIAGEDEEYVWAKASLQDNEVTVWSDSLKEPRHVRYAWATNPEGANLYSVSGLPAVPFSVEIERY